jgi:preprotein translocase subunit SecG
MDSILWTLLDIVHIFVCVFLMLVVLLQQGKGGGMGAAFGGGAAQQVFGGRGAGNLLTRATSVCAAVFMLTSVTLAFHASEGDRAMKQRIAQEQLKKGRGNEGTPRKKEKKAPQDKPAESAPLPAPEAPGEAPTPAPPPSQ